MDLLWSGTFQALNFPGHVIAAQGAGLHDYFRTTEEPTVHATRFTHYLKYGFMHGTQ